ncbi:MAG TPA: tetratricopeptide repeat protein [Draconibacterium sp.]|nr:tetratricopeptide repeat protein [Draconibacterium sp.]HRX12059.1 tetratricopeptide repeat protein [Draconibacterium sp.]
MKRITILFFLFSLILQAEAQMNIDHYMRVGQTRTQIGNYTGAIEYFNIVLRFKPHLAEAYFYRGIAKHQLEDYRGAINDYNTAIDIKPFYPQAYMNRGMAYHNLKNYKKAIADYNRALEFDPDNENIYNNRGIAKLAQKNIEGAIEDYNQALRVNPKSTYALMNRSNAKIVSGDIKGAIKDLNEVIIIRPHYAAAYLNRGIARFELNDYASALRDYDQSINFDPKNALAFNNRGIIKQKLEDYRGAIMDYDMAIVLNPEMASAYFNRAMAKEILKLPGYQNDYSIAAQLNPKFDIESQRIEAEKQAFNQKYPLSNRNQQTSQNQQNNQGNPASANQSAQDSTLNNQNQPNPATAQNNVSGDEESEEKEKSFFDDDEPDNKRDKRRVNLMIEDSRELPGDDEEVDDGLVQNRNIVIDLQPIFIISAFEKNAVDYDRFQYYNSAINEINEQNNYDPLFTISNKSNAGYRPVFENFILFFNEKIRIQQSSHNYLNRGIFYSLTGDYNKSLDDLNRTIDMDSKQGIAYFVRANCRYKMLEEIEILAGLNNEMSVKIGARNLDNANKSNEPAALDYKLILEDYQTTLTLNPAFFFGYFNRAFINIRLGEYKTAIEDLNHAIELEPEFAEAYFNRGLTKIYMDDLEGGALDLSRAGELGIYGAYNIIKRYCN